MIVHKRVQRQKMDGLRGELTSLVCKPDFWLHFDRGWIFFGYADHWRKGIIDSMVVMIRPSRSAPYSVHCRFIRYIVSPC
jgi:hypothetical protein